MFGKKKTFAGVLNEGQEAVWSQREVRYVHAPGAQKYGCMMLLVGYECINCGKIFTFVQKMLSQVRNICLNLIPQCCGPSRSFDMKVEDEKDDEKKVTSLWQVCRVIIKYPNIFTRCKLYGLAGDGAPPSVELSELLVPLLPAGENEISFDIILCLIVGILKPKWT